MVKALVGRPVLERSRGAGLVVCHVVILAKPRAGVTGLFEELRERRAAFRDDAAVARISRRHFLDDAGGHGVVIAPRQQRRPRRGAERRGVELVVEQAFLGQPLRGRHANQAAVDARPSEPDIVEQHQQDIGRALRRRLHRREVRLGIDGVGFNLRVGKFPLRFWQMIAIDMARKPWRFRFRHDSLSVESSNSVRRIVRGSSIPMGMPVSAESGVMIRVQSLCAQALPFVGRISLASVELLRPAVATPSGPMLPANTAAGPTEVARVPGSSSAHFPSAASSRRCSWSDLVFAGAELH